MRTSSCPILYSPIQSKHWWYWILTEALLWYMGVTQIFECSLMRECCVILACHVTIPVVWRPISWFPHGCMICVWLAETWLYVLLAASNHQPGYSTSSILLALLLSLLSLPHISLLPPLSLSPPSLSSLYPPFQWAFLLSFSLSSSPVSIHHYPHPQFHPIPELVY